ncbi:Hypothetical protein FKW44_003559 [Caligus rogercresseyi]|uniref:Uncharacterized protein n=1 Tax=Caligus rogercresseyi TaxID=217165 RepID=A0A7T8KLT8_CALRO|nr:Hypothetical protein FKW44_003559 [Caligus rogercresseyi]
MCNKALSHTRSEWTKTCLSLKNAHSAWLSTAPSMREHATRNARFVQKPTT